MTVLSLFSKSTLIKTVAFAGAMAFSSIFGVANAASQCKGLDIESCSNTEACGWVESYQRKDGRNVKAFCRTSSKGKARKVAETKNDKQDNMNNG